MTTEQQDQFHKLVNLLTLLVDNAERIEWDSYHLQGHEDFNVGSVIAEADALLQTIEKQASQ